MSAAPKPFLTVAIPVYNGESKLAPMFASLDAQDWNLFEVRFGDDGSTDGTSRVLEEFAEKHPGRVFVESHENMGPGLSRNRLLSQARGDYIWFCDADDELVPGCMGRIADILQTTHADFLAFLYGQGNRPDDDDAAMLGVEPIPVSRSQLLLSVLGATVSKVCRIENLRRARIGFPSFRAGEDFVFTVSAACVCERALFWYAKPYWARNGFWHDNGSDHLTRNVGESYCENITEALRQLRSLEDRHSELKAEIGVQRWILTAHFRDRVRDESPPDIRDKWLPVAKGLLMEMAEARDNPLLRIPRSLKRKEDEARRGERIARSREQAIRESLSWRITAPLRAVVRLFSRRRSGGLRT